MKDEASSSFSGRSRRFNRVLFWNRERHDEMSQGILLSTPFASVSSPSNTSAILGTGVEAECARPRGAAERWQVPPSASINCNLERKRETKKTKKVVGGSEKAGRNREVTPRLLSLARFSALTALSLWNTCASGFANVIDVRTLALDMSVKFEDLKKYIRKLKKKIDMFRYNIRTKDYRRLLFLPREMWKLLQWDDQSSNVRTAETDWYSCAFERLRFLEYLVTQWILVGTRLKSRECIDYEWVSRSIQFERDPASESLGPSPARLEAPSLSFCDTLVYPQAAVATWKYAIKKTETLNSINAKISYSISNYDIKMYKINIA